VADEAAEVCEDIVMEIPFELPYRTRLEPQCPPRNCSAFTGRNMSLATESECSDVGYYDQAVVPISDDDDDDNAFDPSTVQSGALSARPRHSPQRSAWRTR
jgi:hypothetical protein